MYNPANFSVNYAASSNYSNSSNYANGAGYADSLRVNGSVVDPNSLGISYGTYTGYEDTSGGIIATSWRITVACTGFVKRAGAKICVYTGSFFSTGWNVKKVITQMNINNTGYASLRLAYDNVSNHEGVVMVPYSMIMFVFDGSVYRLIQDTFDHYSTNCTSDCRCGDDGF